MAHVSVLPLGDGAFTVEFSDLSGPAGARRVRALRQTIEAEIDQGRITGVIDLISATRSLTVCFDPLRADYETLTSHILTLSHQEQTISSTESPLWTLPVCYEADVAPDLEDFARSVNLSPQEVIELHTQVTYEVLLLGFLPGFAFLGTLDERLRKPRRTTPRTAVPAGSVGVANDQTAIYPWQSPGGWHLLGRCPITLFDVSKSPPALLSPGARVAFTPISRDEFTAYQTGELSLPEGDK